MNSVDIQECIIIIFSKSSRRYGIFIHRLCLLDGDSPNKSRGKAKADKSYSLTKKIIKTL